MIAVHGPHTWGEPFYAQNADLIVNLLRDRTVEVKSTRRKDLVGGSPYRWDFGDGSPVVVDGYEVIHRYATPGRKTISVQITTTTGTVTASIEIDMPDGGSGNGAVLRMSPKKTKSKAA